MQDLLLSKIPAEIMDEILMKLRSVDIRAFSAFRESSRSCLEAADSIFYRNIALADTKEYSCKRRQFEECLQGGRPAGEIDRWTLQIRRAIDLLRNPERNIARFVLDLSIGPFADTEYPIDELGRVLVEILDKLPHLQDFRWNTGYRMCPAILRAVVHHLPHCRFHVSQLIRWDARLDEEMLSIPQLTSLDLAVLCDSLVPATEFAILDRILPSQTRLSHLSLRTASRTNETSYRVTHDFIDLARQSPSLNWPWALTIPINGSQLRSLSFGDRVNYDYWQHHSRLWIDAMDWSHLTLLDIQSTVHRDTLTWLTGRVPNLRILELGGARKVYADGVPTREQDFLAQFLLQANKISRLTFHSSGTQRFAHMLQTILECRGSTLSELWINHGFRDGGTVFHFTGPSLSVFCIQITNIQELAIELGPM